MIPTRFLLPLGCALALSSCDVFRPDPKPDPNQAYGAAGAYDANAAGGSPPAYGTQPPANPYGQPPAAGYGAAGGYTQPNYSQPSYTQPANTGAYSGGGYSNAGGGASTSSASGRTHTVASGENLSKISQRYGVTTDALMRANNITNPNFVRAGQKLTIP